MPRVTTRAQEQKVDRAAAVDLQDLPLNTVEDYTAYNKAARRAGIPVKIPPHALHKQFKIKFERFDQPENLLKFIVVNADIDYEGELIPGKTYTLPEPVIRHLESRSVPIFGEVKVNDGSETMVETRQIGERSRFSCRMMQAM